MSGYIVLGARRAWMPVISCFGRTPAHLVVLLAILGTLFACSPAGAEPLSVRIDDHSFTFDVPYWDEVPWGAVYDFSGGAPDTLTVMPPSVASPNHYATSYSYAGKLPTVLGSPFGPAPVPSAFPYPVGNSSTFGGDLKLHMTFDVNDGPYANTTTGDSFDISLVGSHPDADFLTITGQIYTQGFPGGPLYPTTSATDITLLDIQLEEVTILARTAEDRIFLVEGQGILRTLLGVDVAQQPELHNVGVTFYKFFSENPQGPIFTDPNYQPSDDVSGQIFGHIAGEAGAALPEPGTSILLISGLLAMMVCVRRRR